MQSRSPSRSYELFMLVLCGLALVALGYETFFSIDPATRQILTYADWVVCAFFFLDFVLSVVGSPRPARYFFTWGWIDLVSSIPAVPVLRWGRAARIMRILRVLRGLRATRLMATIVLRRRAQQTFLAAVLVTLLLVVFASIAILQFEAVAGANIKTAEDAFWWSVATITTTGAGDRYPVTSEGRAVAATLMIAGVGVFGILSGFVAAWFLAPTSEHQESELQTLQASIDELRKTLAERLPQTPR